MSALVSRWIYGNDLVNTALQRGWTDLQAAIHDSMLSYEAEHGPNPIVTDIIAITHPFNFLTEREVEVWED